MSCNEYITRRQAFEVIAAHKEDILNYGDVLYEIGMIELANIEVVQHSHWTSGYTKTGEAIIICARCKRKTGIRTDYCSNCGARMDEPN